MSDLGYVTLGYYHLRDEAWTQEQQDLRETGVVPGSLRNVSQEARERHAAFWKWVEQRQAEKYRQPGRVVQWRRNG